MIENRMALKGSVSCVLALGLLLAFLGLLRAPASAVSAAEAVAAAPGPEGLHIEKPARDLTPPAPEPGPLPSREERSPAEESYGQTPSWDLTEAPELTSGRVITVCRSGECDFAVIQDAVDAAGPGDEIRLAAGVYTDVNSYAGLAQVVYLSKTVALRGGYTTTNWTTADPEANLTTLDAQGQGRVLYVTGEISPTVEGLRITRGNAAGLRGGPSFALHAGGGVYIAGGQPLLRGNVVLRSTANVGGGLYLHKSGARLIANTISSNTALWGGGLGVSESPAFIEDNTVEYNSASEFGGGLHIRYSHPALRGNGIASNTAEKGGGGVCLTRSGGAFVGNRLFSNSTPGFGGGLYVYQSATQMIGNYIVRNEAGDGGGGLCVERGQPWWAENVIIANRTEGRGGGILFFTTEAVLVNTILADNSARVSGSGVYVGGGTYELLHTTMARNESSAAGVSGDGIGLQVLGGRVALTNTILVGHRVGVYAADGALVSLGSTLLGDEGWANEVDWAGEGEVDHQNDYRGAPRFVEPGRGDYRILTDSAAVDRGVDAGVYTDIDGHPRPIGAGFDLGADESTGIDLSRSAKRAHSAELDLGEVSTYTIVLANSGHLNASDVILYDQLPAGTTYVTGSVVASQGAISYGDGIHWTGTLVPAKAVTVTYRVTVEQPGPIRNTAVITDEYGTVTELTALVNAFRAYLPLISRSP